MRQFACALFVCLVLFFPILALTAPSARAQTQAHLPNIPQTCPATACPAGLTCKDGNCVACGGEEVFSPIEKSSLREYAEKRGMLIGSWSQIDGETLNNEPRHLQTLTSEFNAMKITSTMRWMWPVRENPIDFGFFDLKIRKARENNMRVNVHTLLFGNGTTPEWLGFYDPEKKQSIPDCGGWGRSQTKKNELDGIMKSWITQVVRHGGDDIYLWEVVNEPLSQKENSSNCWYEVFGEEYIVKAFAYAKQALQDTNSKALLTINEYIDHRGVDPAKTQAYFDLIQRMKNQGAQIDVAGIQMHLKASELRESYLDEFKAFLRKAGEIGLQVYITEMTVNIGQNPTQADLSGQKDIYKNTMQTCLDFPNCSGFFTWGVSDKYDWYGNNVLLFDREYRRKSAYYGVANAIAQNETRKCSAPVSRADAAVELAGFFNLDTTVSQKKSPFRDVPASHPYFESIRSIVENGFSGGCGNMRFCPYDRATKAQFLIMLLRGLGITEARLAKEIKTVSFADMTLSDPRTRWVEKAYRMGLIHGCSFMPLKACPDDSINPDQVKAILSRAERYRPIKTFSEVLHWRKLWARGDRRAETNGDGAVNTLDYLALLREWLTP